MTTVNESIMKIDRRGRLRYTAEQKKTMVDAYRASGLSAPRFAALHGVNYQTLVSWIKKGKTAGLADPPRRVHPTLLSLVAAEIEATPAPGKGGPLELHLPGGAMLVIRGEGQVALAAALFRQLQQTRPC
jgi:transposase-like protein